MTDRPIPVILFAYNRPDLLAQTLAALRATSVPLLYVFSDGPRTADQQPDVAAVRALLHNIDWCELVLFEHKQNLGLGVSIRSGIEEVLKNHDMFIVCEDDLVCVPHTYHYLCAALRHYNNDHRVMSVAGWTHPRVTPKNIGEQPYFDGRAECWLWGAWRRSWQGMDQPAAMLMERCRRTGIDVYRYGADLPTMAEREQQQNIWAVRWLYLHILKRGLCLRPPYSMVEHIGFDARATNASNGGFWANPPLKPCPPLPAIWPVPIEHPECAPLWQGVFGGRPKHPWRRLAYRAAYSLQKTWQRTLSNIRGAK